MVNPSDGFSVTRVEGELPRSTLLWRGQPTAVTLDGVTLEHQLQLDGRYLLFLTEDSPYEEGLHIYLLDSERRVVDGLELAAAYAPGTLRGVQQDGAGAVSFSFFGDDRWRLEVNDRPLGLLAARVASPVKRKPGGEPMMTVRRIR